MNKILKFLFLTFAGFGLCLFAIKMVSAQKDKIYDVVILGSGPAGLTAGMYTARAHFSTLVVEGDLPGGLLTTTPVIENWPGEISITGYELMKKMRAHAKHVGCESLAELVNDVDFSQQPYVLKTNKGKTLHAKTVIIATGVLHKKLGCPGEQEFAGKGVSYCATCDAPAYKGKEVVVVGGGNSALIEASHLSRFAKLVTIIHTSDNFHVMDPIKYVVEKTQNIKVIHYATVKQVLGDGKRVTGIQFENLKTHATSDFKVDGIFVAVGFEPNTKMFKAQLDLDEKGYIKMGESTQTSKPGVFVAGDVAHAKYKQAIIAAGEGCRAALDAIEYLDLLRK